ncbi:MAG: hypothetical protein IKE75_03975 [Bacilli bacterium]|nr:hypothetical protein [Bacilli bacterium]
MKHYNFNKDNNIVSGYINDKMSGFKIRPRNNVEYEGVQVSRMVLVSPPLIQNVLKRKIKIKLNAYLNYLISTIEEDDDDAALVLDDTLRYKSIIMNKYSKYLDPKYIRELLFRVRFVEEELRAKIYEQNIMKYGRGR